MWGSSADSRQQHSSTPVPALSSQVSVSADLDTTGDEALAQRLQAEEEVGSRSSVQSPSVMGVQPSTLNSPTRSLSGANSAMSDAELAAMLQRQEEEAAAARLRGASATAAGIAEGGPQAASPLLMTMDNLRQVRSDAELAQRLQREEEVAQAARAERFAAVRGQQQGAPPGAAVAAGGPLSGAGLAPGAATRVAGPANSVPAAGNGTLSSYASNLLSVVMAWKQRLVGGCCFELLRSVPLPSATECANHAAQGLQALSTIFIGPVGPGPPPPGGAGMQAAIGCFSGLQLAACLGCNQSGLCFCAVFGGCLGAASVAGQNINSRGGWRWFGGQGNRQRPGAFSDSESEWGSDSDSAQRGLDEETIDAHTVGHTFEVGPSGGTGSTVDAENGQCMICMETFTAGDALRTLPCLHRYHRSCADEWLRRSPECPICKRNITEAMPLPSGPELRRRGASVRALGARLVRATRRPVA